MPNDIEFVAIGFKTVRAEVMASLESKELGITAKLNYNRIHTNLTLNGCPCNISIANLEGLDNLWRYTSSAEGIIYALDPSVDFESQQNYLMRAMEECKLGPPQDKRKIYLVLTNKTKQPLDSSFSDTALKELESKLGVSRTFGTADELLKALPEITETREEARKKELSIKLGRNVDDLIFMILSQVVEPLVAEKNRLESQEGVKDQNTLDRIEALQSVIDTLRNRVIPNITGGAYLNFASIKAALEKPIQDYLAKLDKRGIKEMDKGWDIFGKISAKAGIMALNAISVLFIVPTFYKRYGHSSHTWFYSVKGKTADAGKKALKDIDLLLQKPK